MQSRARNKKSVSTSIRFDLHINISSRKKYQIEDSLFSTIGNLIIADFTQARIVSERINSVRRNEGRFSEQITPGQINALGLIHEIYHLIIRQYEEDENPGIFGRTLEKIKLSLDEKNLDEVLLSFVEEFPPISVYKSELTPAEFLNSASGSKSNREIILEELILLHIENTNPAARPLDELYSDRTIKEKTRYSELLELIEKHFEEEKPVGKEKISLFAFLRKPIVANPFDIEAQLNFINTFWGIYIPANFRLKILSGRDLLREDYKLFVKHGGGEKATPPVPVYDFDQKYFESLKLKIKAGDKLSSDESRFIYEEKELFTEDTDWMPEVVMLAKNAYVWLDQLSKKYQREIRRLDQIPDEELDSIAKWNFTSVWLIGIWERSSASKKIKHLTGNIDAASSAYSLYDYVIADALGGEPAFENLKSRCWKRGIRLASDMVPNHTGIYSKWMIEKPDYFIQSDTPPYPGYSFFGPNLSEDDRVEIRIEDKYFSRTDAAVVFQRIDKYTGDVRYIYHGNDGTNMPWNDTAQLNLLIPEVREVLIQMIMHVARKTPIIRFDAAMTLAKKHFQRLWFPQPGTGGAIPSRADHSMTREQFDALIPEEFWREVVDRINKEMPNTLLLAEAFWLMEGYFVRTLGMHRVYNSAFMHMMMKEENEKYKLLIKNTLEFNPEILKRYVNFMSNPDEETAINQFGKGDKYFGVATLLVTLPGLPMFGHGQIEGFSEKYGMEYQRAYYNEMVDENLVSRHQKEIFPLMKKRRLYSQVDNFDLYDFVTTQNEVDENVFACTNSSGDEKALIIFNNSYTETTGYIQFSSGRMKSKINSDEKFFFSQKIADALQFKNDVQHFYIYTDHRTKLQYLLSGKESFELGLTFTLRAYDYKVCLNFHEIFDAAGEFQSLCNFLNGRGVESIEHALLEQKLLPLHSSLLKLFDTTNVKLFISYLFSDISEESFKSALSLFFQTVLKETMILDKKVNAKVIESDFFKDIKSLNELILNILEIKKDPKNKKWIADVENVLPLIKKDDAEFHLLLFIQLVLKNLFTNSKNVNESFTNLLIEQLLFEVFEILGFDKNHNYKNIYLIKMLSNEIFLKQFYQMKDKFLPVEVIKNLFTENETSIFLRVHAHEDIKYFNKESFEELIIWLMLLYLQHHFFDDRKTLKSKKTAKNSESKNPKGSMVKRSELLMKKKNTTIQKMINQTKRMLDVSVKSQFKVDEFLRLIELPVKAKKTIKTKTRNTISIKNKRGKV